MTDKEHIAGIFCSDLHFCRKSPPARAAEPSWLDAQKRVIDQLVVLKNTYNAPVFIAGDILDTYEQPAWFINWLIRQLRVLEPKCIPGQHDIPNHQYTQLDRSGYWTLVESGAIEHLGYDHNWEFGNMLVTPFPWNIDIKPPQAVHGLMLQVALVHAYIYTERTGYPGAPPDKLAAKYLPSLKGYDAAFFGDNHTGWFTKSQPKGTVKPGPCSVFNCGVAIRRLHSEQKYRPRVALLHASGVIEPYYLDVGKDKFSPMGKTLSDMSKTLKVDLTAFVTELANLRDTGRNWNQIVKHALGSHNFDSATREVILKALGEIKEEVWLQSNKSNRSGRQSNA